SPSAAMPVEEDDVIELVDRFEAQHQRRIPMLLEDHGGEQRGLQAMGAAVLDDPAEASQRGAPMRLVVVRQVVQEPLNQHRRAKPRDQTPLARAEADSLRSV